MEVTDRFKTNRLHLIQWHKGLSNEEQLADFVRLDSNGRAIICSRFLGHLGVQHHNKALKVLKGIK